LRSQRAFSAGLFIPSDSNDEDIPDITGKIGNDENINLGDNSGLTEKNDSDMGILTRFSHNPTFFYGSNQENKKILKEADEVTSLERSKKAPRSTKARGKRPAAAVNKFKQS
jgi:hypothetical protein